MYETGRAQDKDTIILHNGQMLVGKVQGASLGSISIDDYELKMQNIKLYKIKVLIIHEKFKIQTVQKNIYYSKVMPDGRDGWVIIKEDSSNSLHIPIDEIYMLISLEKQFFHRLNGNITAGLSFTKSSSIGQTNFAANVLFATKHFNYQLAASSIASIDSGNFSRDNENLQFFAAYDLSGPWFLAGMGQYQRNLELNISRRFVEMLGVGNQLFIHTNWQLLVTSGVDFTQERSVDGISSLPQVEIPVMLKFNFYQFKNPDIQINFLFTSFFSITEPGRVRYDGNTNFSWQLIRYFYLTLSPYSNFDNRPPNGSTSNFDYGLVFGLTYKF